MRRSTRTRCASKENPTTNAEQPSPIERISGAIWGHLVGDAVGVPYEFKAASAITSVHFGVPGTHGQPPGPGATTAP